MKERPLLMCAEMVQATLRDVNPKTETRRIIKPQPVPFGASAYGGTRQGWTWKADSLNRGWNDDDADPYRGQSLASLALACECPYGQPGDRLWVKETFYCDHCEYQGATAGLPALSDADKKLYLHYAADGDVRSQIPECEGTPKLKPSIFMPRWASRITLEIVSVRVERLQDISEADVVAEGVETSIGTGMIEGETVYHFTTNSGYSRGKTGAVLAYQDLWESINGKCSWAANPWVWVVTFKKL
jgi:hypothetical protein